MCWKLKSESLTPTDGPEDIGLNNLENVFGSLFARNLCIYVHWSKDIRSVTFKILKHLNKGSVWAACLAQAMFRTACSWILTLFANNLGSQLP